MARLLSVIGWPGAVSGKPEGAPSDSYSMREHILRTMPIVKLYPRKQQMKSGLEIYTVEDCWPDYSGYLEANGISTGDQGPYLQCMYQELSPFGESYSNSFSPSAMASLGEGFSGIAAEVSYITGKNIDTGLEALTKSKNSTVAGVANASLGLMDTAENAAASVIGTDSARQLRNALTSGEKIDFPMMWRGSSWSAQYDFTIRLYNPQPDSQQYHEDLIVAPMAALMALALPKTTDSEDLTYQWPFLVKMEIPGYANLDAGYVSNLSVVKGGDVNDRAWNNRPTIVDIRLTISPLFSTFLLTKSDPASNQPTLRKEVANLKLKKDPFDKEIAVRATPPNLNAGAGAATQEGRNMMASIYGGTSVGNRITGGSPPGAALALGF